MNDPCRSSNTVYMCLMLCWHAAGLPCLENASTAADLQSSIFIKCLWIFTTVHTYQIIRLINVHVAQSHERMVHSKWHRVNKKLNRPIPVFATSSADEESTIELQ